MPAKGDRERPINLSRINTSVLDGCRFPLCAHKPTFVIVEMNRFCLSLALSSVNVCIQVYREKYFLCVPTDSQYFVFKEAVERLLNESGCLRQMC